MDQNDTAQALLYNSEPLYVFMKENFQIEQRPLYQAITSILSVTAFHLIPSYQWRLYRRRLTSLIY